MEKKIRKPVVMKQFKMKKKIMYKPRVFLEPCIEINLCERIRGSGATDVSMGKATWGDVQGQY